MDSTDRLLLRNALEEAVKSLEENTYPVGAVIADESGNIVATGRNHVNTLQDITAHAEIDALRSAGKTILDAKLRRKKLTLFTTLEPCPMCTGAILFAHIHRVVWILNDDTGFGGFRVIKESNVYDSRFERIETIAEPFNDLKEIQLELMDSWSKNPFNIINQRKSIVNLN